MTPLPCATSMRGRAKMARTTRNASHLRADDTGIRCARTARGNCLRTRSGAFSASSPASRTPFSATPSFCASPSLDRAGSPRRRRWCWRHRRFNIVAACHHWKTAGTFAANTHSALPGWRLRRRSLAMAGTATRRLSLAAPGSYRLLHYLLRRAHLSRLPLTGPYPYLAAGAGGGPAER